MNVAKKVALRCIKNWRQLTFHLLEKTEEKGEKNILKNEFESMVFF